jgi:hypothetical protein
MKQRISSYGMSAKLTVTRNLKKLNMALSPDVSIVLVYVVQCVWGILAIAPQKNLKDTRFVGCA